MGQARTTTTTDRDPQTIGVLAVSTAVGVALLALTVTDIVRLQAAAGVLQVLGIALAALGLDVVRSGLELVADKAIAAKHGVTRWAALRRTQLNHWWLRHRGRPVTIYGSGTVSAKAGVSGSGEVVRGRVNRDTVSDRDWLEHLDNEVADLWAHLKRHEERRAADLAEIDERLAADRDRLRDETVRATRQGWELVVAGLAWSAIGAVVGAFG